MRFLHEVVPAIAARLGVPGHTDALGLPDAPTYVVVLVDGMGEMLLREHAELAPFLSSLAAVEDVFSGVPSTTASSLTGLATGMPTGQHGMAGYSCRVPGTPHLLNALKWHRDVDPLQWQPHATVFEQIAAAGHGVVTVNNAEFETSGLTRSTQRGVPYVGVRDAWDRRDAVCDAVEAMTTGVVYAYESALDHAGHAHGVDSDDWRSTLTEIDGHLRELRESLPPETVMVITADHGMIDLPMLGRFDVDLHPRIMKDVALLGGEARFRHVYTRAGAEAEVAARWAAILGDRAEVRLRTEAEDWFGPIDPRVAPRFGDVVVAAKGDFAIFSARRFAIEMLMKGFHGSVSDVERRVPVLHG